MRDLVLRGEFKAGDRLTELALVETLGLSRTPIRAALQQLTQEGLLEAVQPTGYLVRGFSESEIFDAIEVRGTIEGLAARMAAERGVSQPTLRDMRDCLAKIDEVLTRSNLGDGQLARFGALNEQFHHLLLHASGSEMVKHAMSRVVTLPFASPNAFVLVQAKIPGSLEILKIAQAQHHDIVDALEERSSARAEPLLREHARNARKNLELVLRNTDALRHLVGAPLIRRRGGT
ncbi:MAG: GntR family transcriptional regulator [Proteobacteria bacterium]|nr:GntR family transcriptional regulator [Pseudomonadota bacterium]